MIFSMRLRFFLLWCLLLTVLILGAWGVFCRMVVSSRDIRVEEQEYALPQWSAETPPLRVVVLADLHLAAWEGEKLDDIVQRTLALRPDLILLLGDLPYGVCNSLSLPEEECYTKLAPLAEAAPVAYIIGNHDWYYRRLRASFRKLGFLNLGEATRRLHFAGGQVLDIIGFTWSHGPVLTKRLPNNVAQAGDVPMLGLAHYPESFYRHPLPEVEAVLAAHTHGGQLCDADGMPLRGLGILTREQTRGGWHKRPDGKALYITRGIGMSIFPLRLNCPAEITLLRLKGAGEEGPGPKGGQ